MSHPLRETNLPNAENRTGVKRSSSLLSCHSLRLLTQQLGLHSRWRQLSLSHQLPVASCLSASPFFSLLLLNTLSLPSRTTWLSVPSLKKHKALTPPPHPHQLNYQNLPFREYLPLPNPPPLPRVAALRNLTSVFYFALISGELKINDEWNMIF